MVNLLQSPERSREKSLGLQKSVIFQGSHRLYAAARSFKKNFFEKISFSPFLLHFSLKIPLQPLILFYSILGWGKIRGLSRTCDPGALALSPLCQPLFPCSIPTSCLSLSMRSIRLPRSNSLSSPASR